jgi:hypothetical protein
MPQLIFNPSAHDIAHRHAMTAFATSLASRSMVLGIPGGDTHNYLGWLELCVASAHRSGLFNAIFSDA